MNYFYILFKAVVSVIQLSYHREVELLKEQLSSVESQLKDKQTLITQVNSLMEYKREAQSQVGTSSVRSTESGRYIISEKHRVR